ncbi:adiponectin receptor protein isoform X2 [Harmonia axyridis]|uniref:adiponectin receptor protein isoform X2 n=1 Tax=Harmonia axyridis TaxID=115357 RepID=UPI001E277C7A|nr:adiponectin receptor protein isoform X2 [Harmonia axyridis]
MSHYSDAEDSIGESAESEGLRKRKVWDLENESLTSEIKELLDDDVNSLVEEDCVGCPLPSTPEDEAVLDSEMSEVLKAAVLGDELDITALAHNAASQAEHVVRKMIQAGWSVCHFRNLPAWLQDNDFLIFGHRPPLPSFRACFKSIFRIHTETANIWTHLLGCVAFIGLAVFFVIGPPEAMYLGEKIVFGAFFLAAITCFWFSTLFHTFCCYDPFYRNLFSKLDYCGITILIIGSFVPWVYYGFYCDFRWKIIYLTGVCFLGAASVIVSWWEKFSKPEWRLFRTGVFMTFSLAGLAPAIHFGVREGCHNYTAMKTLIWLFLMGTLHLVGAVFYTIRVPERFCPGLATYFLQSPPIQVEFQEKLVFCFFFCGAILCLGLSTLFHTVSCHSKNILNVFSKLDYCGISLLIMGSIVPWLYYSFYCHFRPKLVYTIVTCAMGVATMVVSLWDEFSKSERRHIRAGLFLLFGLSGVVPAIHFGMLEGWFTNIFQKSIASMILMGLCYIAGTMLYALRVPERFYPGKFDIWLHSHQIFHVFVLGGAYFHYQGLMEIARDRLEIAQCEIS